MAPALKGPLEDLGVTQRVVGARGADVLVEDLTGFFLLSGDSHTGGRNPEERGTQGQHQAPQKPGLV